MWIEFWDIFFNTALIAFVFIVMGGYMWIVSGGDPSRVKQAQGIYMGNFRFGNCFSNFGY
jgi:hypothetical protein